MVADVEQEPCPFSVGPAVAQHVVAAALLVGQGVGYSLFYLEAHSSLGG